MARGTSRQIDNLDTPAASLDQIIELVERLAFEAPFGAFRSHWDEQAIILREAQIKLRLSARKFRGFAIAVVFALVAHKLLIPLHLFQRGRA